MKTTTAEKKTLRARWNELAKAMHEAKTVEEWRAYQERRIELERMM